MDIETRLNEKIKRFEDLKNQLDTVSKQIGALSEQQRAIYQAGLELKGQIDALAELKQDEAARTMSSATAKLTLPEGVKPIIPEVVQ